MSTLAHGHARRGQHSYTYNAWMYMKDRLARDPDYAGVTMCKRWKSFEAFLSDMGERPQGLSLDRISNDRGYMPSNCRWATAKEQQNNKASNIRVQLNGRTQTLKQWTDELGLNYKTVHNRINACGWAPEAALTKPHRGWNKSGRLPIIKPAHGVPA